MFNIVIVIIAIVVFLVLRFVKKMNNTNSIALTGILVIMMYTVLFYYKPPDVSATESKISLLVVSASSIVMFIYVIGAAMTTDFSFEQFSFNDILKPKDSSELMLNADGVCENSTLWLNKQNNNGRNQTPISAE